MSLPHESDHYLSMFDLLCMGDIYAEWIQYFLLTGKMRKMGLHFHLQEQRTEI